MMEFLSIPAEVIDAGLLPYLGWNDLLRFRRVCKATKDVTDGYLKVHPELAPEIEINEEDNNFREFLGLTTVPPTTSLFLNNVSGAKFYGNAGESGMEFLERLGPHVRHLRVNQLSECPVDMELNFLEAFVNLESFEAGRVLGCNEIVDMNGNLHQQTLQDQSERSSFPMSVLQKLKALKIDNDEEAVDVPNILKFGLQLLQSSGDLQVATLPFNPNTIFDANDSTLRSGVAELANHRDNNPMAVAFTLINEYIQKRFINTPPGSTSFKVFDFINFHHDNFVMELPASPIFMLLCMICVMCGVKLRNVGSSWFYARILLEIEEFRSFEPDIIRLKPEYRKAELGSSVLSIINLHPSMFPLNMPNLERIEIRSTLESSPGVHWRQERPQWPSLSTLEITVDSLYGGVMEYDVPRGRFVNLRTSTKNLLKFFFEDITREALTEFQLKFSGRLNVVIPKVEDIVSSCPNIRKLTIINWPGTNKALTKLWMGLPGLEEVSLEYCEDLGNVAFVGQDVNSPVFLKLTKLRKLSLKGLDLMPKITDRPLSLVIRHLKLTHLTLTSGDPVNSVTVEGFRSLLGGPFAESIQKFSFRDWSLVNVSSDEFKLLEREFRSYYML